MRNKTKSQNTFPPPLPSSRAQFHSQILYLSPPQQCRRTGKGDWGHLVTCYLCRSFLLRGRTPQSSPASAWGPSHGRQFSTNFSIVSPSHGLQFFTNCSSVGPFHGLQSFKHRLFQCGSPVGSQVLPANLLQRGLLSPQICRSCQEPAPARASHGVTASFGHPPAPAWGPPWAAGGDLLPRGPPWAAGGQPASPWSSPRAAGESLLRRLEHLLPLLLH